MAFQVYEMYDSRRVNIAWDQQSADLTFFGFGTTDDVEARAGFLSVIPNIFFGLLLEDIEIRPVGGGFWLASAPYRSIITEVLDGVGDTGSPPTPPSTPSPNTPIGPEFSFDINGVTEHIT